MSQVEDGPGCAEGRWALDFLFRGNGQNSSQPLLWRWGTEDADLLFSFTRPWDLKDKRLYKIEEGTTHLVENILLFSFGNNYKKKGVKVRFFLCLLVLFLCIEKVWAKGRGPLYAASGLNITDANTATSAGLWLNEQLIMLKLMLLMQGWPGWGCSLWRRRLRRMARNTWCGALGSRWRPATPPIGALCTGRTDNTFTFFLAYHLHLNHHHHNGITSTTIILIFAQVSWAVRAEAARAKVSKFLPSPPLQLLLFPTLPLSYFHCCRILHLGFK